LYRDAFDATVKYDLGSIKFNFFWLKPDVLGAQKGDALIGKRILVVDDDPKIRTMLRRCLEGESYEVSETSNLSETLSEIESHPPDLITLDLQLGSDDGLDVARAIRKISNVPIVMVTGKADIIDRIVGLEIGADDYIVKPFHVREVIARVKSVLRRTAMGAAQTFATASDAKSHQIAFDGLVAIPDQIGLMDRDDAPITLTGSEFKLLQIFLDRPKRRLTRDQLMELMGGHDYAPLDRTVDNQIARLRKKIERDPAHPELIKTIRGMGYIFTADVIRVGV